MNRCKDQGNPLANRFLLLMGHLALATGSIVRMRVNLMYVDIQGGVKQEKYWKIHGVTEALRQILTLSVRAEYERVLSVLDWKGQGRRVPQEALS